MCVLACVRVCVRAEKLIICAYQEGARLVASRSTFNAADDAALREGRGGGGREGVNEEGGREGDGRRGHMGFGAKGKAETEGSKE